jgi:large subunit ribosomal protein L10
VFTENPVLVLCTFQGIKVRQDFELRSAIRKAGAEYRVIPNRLARLAAEGTPCEAAMSGLKGMTSLVYAKDDPVGLLKALINYSKTNPVLGFKSGVVEGQRLDEKGLTALSTMPGKQELQAKVLYLINAPATNFVRQVNAVAQHVVGVLNAPARDLVSVLKQATDQGKFK